jgi:ribosomal protein S18 acetylase RimI-like enzyme
MEIAIRLARIADLEAVRAIDSYYAAGHPEREEEIKSWLLAAEAYVAVPGGVIRGYASLGKQFGRPFIDMLMVAENSRGMGIGNRLVAHLEGLTEGPELWTSTNLSNQPMQGLLASRGYRMTGFIDNLDPGDPELFYFKELER